MPVTASGVTLRGVRPGSDLDLLQGSWVTVEGPKEARFLVCGERYAFEYVGGDIYMGTFVLDPHTGPKRMDMWIDEGPAAHKGLLTHCIYQLDGELLRWCPARPGSDRRLTAFPSVSDAKYLSLVFRHTRPRA